MHHTPTDPTSLEKLHDIVQPESLSLWWPLAPGWWLILSIIAVVLLVTAWRWGRAYYQNAYRRYAVRLLLEAQDVQVIASILKRVALTAYPRTEVAALAGDDWVSWLAAHCESPIAPDVAGTLREAVYSQDRNNAVDKLREFAHLWITTHTVPETRQSTSERSRPC